MLLLQISMVGQLLRKLLVMVSQQTVLPCQAILSSILSSALRYPIVFELAMINGLAIGTVPSCLKTASMQRCWPR